ncbi:MAG: hypothetical protein AABZ12_01975 [Planctomycetota bacterium]
MTQIPSHIAVSAAGAPIQSRETARQHEAQRTGDAQAAATQVRALDEADVTVETADGDTRVFGDADGGGSQGRTLGEPSSDEPPAESGPIASGITQDLDGRLHVDLEA